VHRPNPRALTWNFVKVLTATSLTYKCGTAYFCFGCIKQSPESASAPPAYALTWNYVKVLSCH